MYNVAAMAVTQPLLLAGKKAGHRLVAPGVLQKTARMHFTRQGLSSGAPEEATCKHNRKASFCLHN